jgi:FtsH-binding integral membrane protein
MFEVISTLFIRFDTLKMMERAKSGSSDFIEDALKLYFDYFAVLGRLLLYHFEGKDESNT